MAGIGTKSEALLRPLKGQIALVTGASRGIGRGIAVQLGQAGATVYITGRRPTKASTELPSLEQTANEISNRGGEPVLVYCDHANSEDVKALFAKIEKDNEGTLDILVNNAYSGVQTIMDNAGKKFYECEPEYWDQINEVGLRNTYFCCVYAARLMANRGKGLIVNVSSVGGLQYLFSVPYGIGKAAVDRMSVDMAVELKSEGVTVVSLWPGLVKTELIEKYKNEGSFAHRSPEVTATLLRDGETPEFVGKAVVGLASDRNILNKTGKIHLTVDLAEEYGFTDVDGQMPSNMRSLRSALQFARWTRTAQWIPTFIKLPKLALHLATSKF